MPLLLQQMLGAGRVRSCCLPSFWQCPAQLFHARRHHIKLLTTCNKLQQERGQQSIDSAGTPTAIHMHTYALKADKGVGLSWVQTAHQQHARHALLAVPVLQLLSGSLGVAGQQPPVASTCHVGQQGVANSSEECRLAVCTLAPHTTHTHAVRPRQHQCPQTHSVGTPSSLQDRVATAVFLAGVHCRCPA